MAADVAEKAVEKAAKEVARVNAAKQMLAQAKKVLLISLSCPSSSSFDLLCVGLPRVMRKQGPPM